MAFGAPARNESTEPLDETARAILRDRIVTGVATGIAVLIVAIIAVLMGAA